MTGCRGVPAFNPIPAVAALEPRSKTGLAANDPIAAIRRDCHSAKMDMAAVTRLGEAQAALYGSFKLPVPEVIEGCPCCISTRGGDVLLTTPLREITGQQLWRYVSGAFLTVGNVRDFRYLLPRILEVSVTDPANANDPEIVIGKLALAEWRSWSDHEQQAIESFLDAWFDLAILRDMQNAAHGPIGWEAESVLCGAARAGVPLDGWLNRLEAASAVPVLNDLKARFPNELSGFWEGAPAGLAQLSAFLHTQQTDGS